MQAILLALASALATAEGADGRLDPGEALLGELACTRCHAAEPEVQRRLATRRAPDLEDVGGRWTPHLLRRFLDRPHGERPGSPMPDVLAGLDEAERERTVDALTHWLVSRGGPLVGEALEVAPTRVESGRQLFHSVGCVACHAPQEPAWALDYGFWELDQADLAAVDAPQEESWTPEGTLPPRSVPLGNLAERTSVAALADFLEDPLAVRPSGRMPSLGLSRGEAEDIALYLLRGQARGIEDGLRRAPGLAFERHDGRFSNVDPGGGTFAGAPTRVGVVSDLEQLPEHPADHFAFRFDGFLEVEATGSYSFSTRSDDGSRLHVAGQEVVDNDGNHAPTEVRGEVWLEEGVHALTVTWFEFAGGEELAVRWKGPGFDWSPLPGERLSHASVEYRLRTRDFEVDPDLAREGELAFQRLGCAACHEERPPEAPPLAELDLERGCLGEGLPARYDLGEAERAALRATLTDLAALAEPLPADLAAAHTLERFGCVHCHRRDGVGGVHPERAEYFRSKVELDLGNEGRLPPHLEDVGAKLREPWLRAVLEDPDARVRPYLSTRMPAFGEGNLAGLVEALVEADLSPGDDVEPPFSEERVALGRQLVGTGGLGCIQCHEFGGYPSLGIPAVDLAHVHERIRPGWFHTLLTDPRAVGMNSRMPVFQDSSGLSPVRDVLGGDLAEQARAVRTYLSLGPAMPLPEGLLAQDSRYELDPLEGIVQASVFLEGVGPRVLLVGTPSLVHFAFDVESSTLTHLWRGRFFNAKGTWHGRAGALERIPDSSSLSLPLDAPLARLDEPAASWPRTRGRDAGLHPVGRALDAEGLPRFRYRWEGMLVEDAPAPSPAGGVHRALVFEADAPPEDVAFLLARAESIEALGPLSWRVGSATIELSCGGTAPRLRSTPRGDELLLDLAPGGGFSGGTWRATAEVEYRWE